MVTRIDSKRDIEPLWKYLQAQNRARDTGKKKLSFWGCSIEDSKSGKVIIHNKVYRGYQLASKSLNSANLMSAKKEI